MTKVHISQEAHTHFLDRDNPTRRGDMYISWKAYFFNPDDVLNRTNYKGQAQRNERNNYIKWIPDEFIEDRLKQVQINLTHNQIKALHILADHHKLTKFPRTSSIIANYLEAIAAGILEVKPYYLPIKAQRHRGDVY